MTHESDGDMSPGQKAFTKRRREAAKTIRKRMLGVYQAILAESGSKEQHQFAALIDWAMRIFDFDDLLDLFMVSGATIRRWAAGTTYPGPLALETVVRRLNDFVQEQIDA